MVNSASATFTENKTMAILEEPLVVSGTLEYHSPDILEKTALTPMFEKTVLNGDMIAITRTPGGHAQEFSTASIPQIKELTEGILGTLSGDLPSIQKIYDVRFSGGRDGWQLVLVPKGSDVRNLIAWMAIRGHQNHITDIDTESTNGDHSEMTVQDTTVDEK
ncbi:MAG: hypothetical protein POH28_07640 [Acidocella sp.]|nr:hypothetical protein [Acidocella sp.]